MKGYRLLACSVFILFAACGTATEGITGDKPLPAGQTVAEPVSDLPASTKTVTAPAGMYIPSRTPTFTPYRRPTPTPKWTPNLTATAEKVAEYKFVVTVTAVAVGGGHTCAITSAGGVKCWGNNDHGQLGNWIWTYNGLPVDVRRLSKGVTAITAGWGHTCAVVAGGVKCWGYNKNGELGDGTTEDRDYPADVSGLTSGVIAIAAGDDHTCAVLDGGGVKCWGYNKYGQLGDGTTTNSAVPVDVVGISGGAKGIAAGWGHTCALTDQGSVVCWGNNENGQLGDGSTADSRTTVADVAGLNGGIASIAAYGGHTCAVTEYGGVKCWGANKYGQLGDGTSVDRRLPVDVRDLTDIAVTVSAGSQHTCARMTGGAINCWGWNYYGQLGDGTTGSKSTPKEVKGIPGTVVALGLGGNASCGIVERGDLFCWGDNASGQLGSVTVGASSVPLPAAGIRSPIRLEKLLDLNGHGPVAFSKDGKLLAAVSKDINGEWDKVIVLWNTDTWEEDRRLTTIIEGGGISDIKFSPDGKWLACGTYEMTDRAVRIWDTSTWSELPPLGGTGEIDFSPDSRSLVASSLWNSKDKHPYAARISSVPDGRLILGIIDPTVNLLERLDLSPDGTLLAGVEPGFPLRIWHAQTGDAVEGVQAEGQGDVTFSPDGKLLAFGNGRGGIGLWKVDPWEYLSIINNEVEHFHYSMDFSPDGRILASPSSHDQSVILWDIPSGAELLSLRSESGSVKFSPDGGILIMSDRKKGTVGVWRILQ
jgi:alpha-tubulin suppressor-like RCC1 family protein